MLGKKPFALALFCYSLLFGLEALAESTDVQAIRIQRQGLLNLISYIDQKPDIFNRSKLLPVLLNRSEKQTVLDVWGVYLDYMATLGVLADKNELYQRQSSAEHDRRMQIHAFAMTAYYRFGLAFISRIGRDPELVKWLNLAHPDLELPAKMYQKFSNQVLSDWNTVRFDDLTSSLSVDAQSSFAAQFSADRLAVRQQSRTGLLVANSAGTVSRSLFRTWFPIQRGVAKGMGKVKVWRIGETLITPEQALSFSRDLEPGDFYLTRKEWRLTNVGIPGFWTHSAIYIGSHAEREQYFDTPEVKQWLAEQGFNSFDALLRATSEIYARHPGYDAMGEVRAIEALNAGVIFNSIETSLAADGAAIFRPLLGKLEKAKAIHNAFYYTGQPYDFDFDFDSDNAMVCSELIFKAYQAGTTQTGVDFPLYTVAGRKMLTPNEIAQWYDATVDTAEQEIELVMFIDGNEKDRVAFRSNSAAFKGSWQRPDWYLFKQSPSALIDAFTTESN
ncbi:YiiX/YebB-like N1pC/P60 family cysteine hydrolase [Reinekea sp.]|uniref:YiiX/YebB-like N1pC/P60 family cysteine hydrolase n=1 Tax=Reinekea sp. TaxID=1970455 RepID=UPI00257AB979|nr:YiiX/YebB-like N1pC/P60 family cysteine hydrolase [Reinekea sp.]